MQPTILITAPALSAGGMRLLQAEGFRVLFTSLSGGLPEMMKHLSCERVNGVISRTLPFDADAFEIAGPSLKVIARHGAGFENIDILAATKRRIPVLIAPSNAQSVAELTIGLMIASARRIVSLDESIRLGEWPRSVRGIMLSARTLGIVGFGNVGKLVARAATGLGMRVIAFDPSKAVDETRAVELVETLEDLLRRSDVLSLHVPLTSETRGMIGADELAKLPPGAIVINTARGGLVDENALAAGIAAGHIFGAGLDTFATEPPPPEHPLLDRPEIVLTSHIGGSTDEALDAVASLAAKHAIAVIRGDQVDRSLCVNPEILG